ncbi:hypothetical protein C8Q80DRAFT_1281547 [Daedaleopsis nitida]|nr:hypothetical protein C8Q80DRAFT_1281547 [Daedaleopsis nitida]
MPHVTSQVLSVSFSPPIRSCRVGNVLLFYLTIQCVMCFTTLSNLHSTNQSSDRTCCNRYSSEQSSHPTETPTNPSTLWIPRKRACCPRELSMWFVSPRMEAHRLHGPTRSPTVLPVSPAALPEDVSALPLDVSLLELPLDPPLAAPLPAPLPTPCCPPCLAVAGSRFGAVITAGIFGWREGTASGTTPERVLRPLVAASSCSPPAGAEVPGALEDCWSIDNTSPEPGELVLKRLASIALGR